jgi:hypothetical protein
MSHAVQKPAVSVEQNLVCVTLSFQFLKLLTVRSNGTR